jgi:hypothetical protein
MKVTKDQRRSWAMGSVVVLIIGIAAALAACSSSGSSPKAAASATPTAASAPASTPAPASSAGTARAPASTATPASSPDAAPAAAAAPVAAPTPGVCGEQRYCYETGEFAATVTNFRTSVVSYYRIIDATLRFQNKTDRPLILGYANASGMAVDEKGNRYGVGGPNAFRGIGLVSGQSFDPKFVIQPGSSAEAKFELSWAPGNAIVGSTFELDLTVNKINTVEGNQHTLGGEFPMTFRALVNELPPAK